MLALPHVAPPDATTSQGSWLGPDGIWSSWPLECTVTASGTPPTAATRPVFGLWQCIITTSFKSSCSTGWLGILAFASVFRETCLGWEQREFGRVFCLAPSQANGMLTAGTSCPLEFTTFTSLLKNTEMLWTTPTHTHCVNSNASSFLWKDSSNCSVDFNSSEQEAKLEPRCWAPGMHLV